MSTLVATNTYTSGIGTGTVDGLGNFYAASDGDVYKWATASQTQTFLFNNANAACLIADGAGNILYGNQKTVGEWLAASGAQNNLISWGPNEQAGLLAADLAGNIYLANDYNISFTDYDNSFYEWVAASNVVIPLCGGDTSAATGIAVDGGGNVYIGDGDNTGKILEWSATTKSKSVIYTPPPDPYTLNPWAVAVDAGGNLYFTEYLYTSPMQGFVRELPRAFVGPNTRSESAAAGSDSLTVLPATENLLPPFAPTSDQPWLSITSVSNGVVSFSFTANTGPARSANITVLGQPIAVSQAGLSHTRLYGTKILAKGSLQFSFTNTPGASFTVLSSTNVSLQLDQWTQVGAPVEGPPGQYQFTGASATNSQRFYIIRSP